MDNINNDSAFVNDDSVYKKSINPTPKPEIDIGVDTKGVIYDNIIAAGKANSIDLSAINSFLQVADNRNQIYDLLDTMAQDSLISAVLKCYAEDATEPNDQGHIVWVESSDAAAGKYVQFLLDTMNVDKHIFSWAHSLCKYGDVYLRLYHQSEYDDALFANKNVKNDYNEDNSDKSILNEDINIKAFSKNDKYKHYLELYRNPADIFELTKFGKTYAYIKAPTNPNQTSGDMGIISNTLLNQYKFNKRDIDIYGATDFVHGCLENNSSRTTETVDIFIDNDEPGKDSSTLSYTVKRGQSLLYDSFKIWRQLQLLEASVLLNRMTKSSVIRMINVEVGDMPKEQVPITLDHIKQLIEQKAALNTDNSMSEYTNPGPIENTVYIPTRGGVGGISIASIGGDVDVKGLADLDYFKRRLFGSLEVPQQYFGETEDAAGFSGGESLARISARYAKSVKKIQNVLIQMLTDAVNIMLIDKGQKKYINKFTIRMQPPTTIEEIERRDNKQQNIGVISDIMNTLGDIQDPSIKLKITKSLLSSSISNTEVIDLIQEEIDKLEQQPQMPVENDNEEISDNEPMNLGNDLNDMANELGAEEETNIPNEQEIEIPNETPESNIENETVLPMPSELGQDFTDNENF